jgi:very-short-patch-repair endonuclease
VCEEFPVVGTRQTIDFFNITKRVAIEVDGVQHDKFNKFFHNNDRFKYADQLIRDDIKEKWCKKNGITLIRIKPHDLPLSKSFFENMGITL